MTTCSSTLICNSLPVTINTNTSTGPLSDIAFGSNGNLYAMTSQHLVQVDTNSCTGSHIISFGSSPTSLVGAINGKMYAASDTLYEVDLSVPSITNLGVLPCTSGGDLAFLNGQLYMTCQGGDLLQVDINNPINSTNLGNLGGSGNWFSLWIEYASCGNSQLFAANEDDIYNLTLSPLNTSFHCSLGWAQWYWIDGATSHDDYLASGCNTVPSNLTASFSPSNLTICEGDSITFTDNSSGTVTGWTWTFNGGTPGSANTQGPHTVGFNTAGNYNIILQVTDGTNTDDTTISITINPSDTAAFTYPSGSYCLVDPDPLPTITGTTGGTFSIDNSGVINGATGLIDITGSGVGAYVVTYITNGTCPDTATFNINIVTSTDATITQAGPFCENDPSVTLIAVDPGGNWTGTGITNATTGVFDPATAGAGNHVITYTITGSCGDIDTMTIVVNPSDTAAFTYSSGSYCLTDPNSLPNITGTAGGNFTINNGGIINSTTGELNINSSGVGTFIITYTTNGTCPDTSSIVVTINNISNATITQDGPFCTADGAINLTSVDGGGVWSGTGITNTGTGTFDPSVAGAGTHQIIYTINGACGDVDTIDIIVNSSPSVSLTEIDDNCFRSEGSLTSLVNGGISPYSYSWSNGGITPSITDLKSGTYSLTVTDSAGCMNTVIGVVNDQNDDCNYHIFLPNIFSPNGDNHNDIFKVRGEGIKALSFVVYSRWGEKVFETNDPDIGWNGNYKGEKMNAGVFVYYVKATMINNKLIEKQGNVTLVR